MSMTGDYTSLAEVDGRHLYGDAWEDGTITQSTPAGRPLLASGELGVIPPSGDTDSGEVTIAVGMGNGQVRVVKILSPEDAFALSADIRTDLDRVRRESMSRATRPVKS